MAEILIASPSGAGHVGPLLSVAQDLAARGDRVTVLTGSVHGAAIRAVGAQPHPLSALADVDGRSATSSGRGFTKALGSPVIRPFLAPMEQQAAELAVAMTRTRFDAIIADSGFYGVLPLLLGGDPDRPAVLCFTSSPPTLSSRDTAPAGTGLPPRDGGRGRLRNRVLNTLAQRVILRGAQRRADAMLSTAGVRRLPVSVLDVGLLADRLVVPTVPSFEYPRSDLAPNVCFVGAVHPPGSTQYRRPDWWPALDGNRPVVHVFAGTAADPKRLLEPTLKALGGGDVLVVATTGGAALTATLPSNVLVAERVPYDLLLPRVDVIVSDGDYGVVQRAVSTGVPLVVAGGTGATREVAARVGWSGAGIDLRTGSPGPEAVGRAVREILGDTRYLRRARELECAFARRCGVAEIASLVDEVTRERRPTSPRRNSAGASWIS